MAMLHNLEPGDVRVLRHGKGDSRVATLLPGIGYTVDMPLLYFTGRLLLQRDWTLDEVWWRPPQVGVEEWAVEQAERLVLRVHEAETPLVVAKSLGTLAMPLTVGTRTAGIWLTPLLDRPQVASAAASLDNRHLLIGGTADKTWVPSVAETSPAAAVSVDGANHSLEVPDTQASVGVLTRVLTEIAAHLDDLTASAEANDQ